MEEEKVRTMRDTIFHICALSLALVGLVVLGYGTWADEVIFHNGDIIYGKAVELPDGSVSVTRKGITKFFQKKQVNTIHYGVDSATGRSGATSTILAKLAMDVTGAITHRTKVKTLSGKWMMLDVEDGFDVPVLNLFPTRYGFYNRRGSFLVGMIVNPATKPWRAVTMRLHLYDSKDKILTSKDFYLFRIPPATPKGPGRRKFEVNLPDVPYERIARMRLVRKF